MVIVLIAIITSVITTRFESLNIWKQKSDIRKFANAWQLLHEEAKRKGEGFRLIIDLESDSYYVRSEIPLEEKQVQFRQVDYLRNLRTKKEKERRAKKEQEELETSLEDEFKAYDLAQSRSIDKQLYSKIFRDPNASFRISQPINFPSLGETQKFSDGVEIRDVIVNNEELTSGQTMIRFSPAGSTSFAVVHLKAQDAVFTIYLDPGTGRIKIFEEDKEIKWGEEDEKDL